MNTSLRVLVTALVLALAAGCNRDGLQLPTDVEKPKAAATEQAAEDPFVVSATVAKTGAAVDERGEITDPKASFAVGDTVFLSMDAKGRRQGDRVHVYWFHQDGKARKDEGKVLSGPFVHFEFAPTETGKYQASVDVNERPVGLVDFEVK